MGADKRPLYERDPEAWNASLAEGNARQPPQTDGDERHHPR
jgi:hypothetical protein